MGTSRRDFLKITTAAAAGAALPLPDERAGEDPPALVRRTLGRTGLELPIVSMGSSYAVDLVRAALDAGIVYIHTSSGYGRHEHLLGRAVRGRDRDSFVVATSPDLPYRSAPGGGPSLDVGTTHNPKDIAASLENSLREMALDHVDIFYLPSVGSRGTALHEPYWEAFAKFKREGKVRFAGITTHSHEPEVIRAAVEGGFWDVVLTAFNFRQSHREQIRAAIHEAHAAGIGVVAMKTQAGVYWDREKERKINMVAALKWVLADEHVHTTIPAFANLEQLRADVSAARDPVMTPSQRRDLEAGDDLGLSTACCEQCGECLSQCPAGMDVPALMRSYMYAGGHGQPGKARHTLRSWIAGGVACRGCDVCAVQCPRGIDVRARALDVATLLDVPGELLG